MHRVVLVSLQCVGHLCICMSANSVRTGGQSRVSESMEKKGRRHVEANRPITISDPICVSGLFYTRDMISTSTSIIRLLREKSTTNVDDVSTCVLFSARDLEWKQSRPGFPELYIVGWLMGWLAFTSRRLFISILAQHFDHLSHRICYLQ